MSLKKRKLLIVNTKRFDVVKIEHDLNTFPALKDVKMIVYRLIWEWRMKELKKELFRLMVFTHNTWESRLTGEALFQFRDISTDYINDVISHSCIYKVFGSVGKPIEHTIDNDDIVCSLPDNYYTYHNLETIRRDFHLRDII